MFETTTQSLISPELGCFKHPKPLSNSFSKNYIPHSHDSNIPHRKIITKTGGWIHHLQPFNWWCLTSLKLNMEPKDEPLKGTLLEKKTIIFWIHLFILGVCMIIPPCRKESDLYCHYWLRKFRVESWGGVKNNQKHVGVSENGGTPKSSILIRISIINRPFWGPPIFGNTHV